MKIEKISGNIIQADKRMWGKLFTPYEPINKMLSEGVEVYGTDERTFSIKKTNGINMYGLNDSNHFTHKALLINIQPIKKETAEDVLREIYANRDDINEVCIGMMLDRIKAVLSE